MKKKEVFIVVVLVLFGFLYYSIRNVDFGFLKRGTFSFESTRLETDTYHEFVESEKSYVNIKKIAVQNVAGSVYVERSDNDQITCKVIVRVYHHNRKKAEKIWKSIAFLKDVSTDELLVHVENFSTSLYNRVRILFFIRVPVSVGINITNSLGETKLKGTGKDIRIKSDFGNVDVENIDSDLDIEIYHANAMIRNITGKLVLKSRFSEAIIDTINALEVEGHYGSLNILNIIQQANVQQSFGNLMIASSQNVKIKARNTRISAKDIRKNLNIGNTNERIELARINGNISIDAYNCKIDLLESSGENLVVQNTHDYLKIHNFSGTNVNLSSRDGQIEFHFFQVKESVTINTSYSEIKLLIPPSTNPSFNIKNEFGNIVNMSSLGLEIKPSNQGKKYSLFYEGQLPRITINSLYGNIFIATK